MNVVKVLRERGMPLLHAKQAAAGLAAKAWRTAKNKPIIHEIENDDGLTWLIRNGRNS